MQLISSCRLKDGYIILLFLLFYFIYFLLLFLFLQALRRKINLKLSFCKNLRDLKKQIHGSSLYIQNGGKIHVIHQQSVQVHMYAQSKFTSGLFDTFALMGPSKIEFKRSGFVLNLSQMLSNLYFVLFM